MNSLGLARLSRRSFLPWLFHCASLIVWAFFSAVALACCRSPDFLVQPSRNLGVVCGLWFVSCQNVTERWPPQPLRISDTVAPFRLFSTDARSFVCQVCVCAVRLGRPVRPAETSQEVPCNPKSPNHPGHTRYLTPALHVRPQRPRGKSYIRQRDNAGTPRQTGSRLQIPTPVKSRIALFFFPPPTALLCRPP